MTVRELIELLSEFRPDARVMVDGYEGGVAELNQVTMKDVLLNYHEGLWFYGPHEVVDSTEIADDDRDTFTVESVVYLPR